MNFQKWTEKSIESIGFAQSLATENGNSQIEQEHLLLALMSQENGLIPEILKSFGFDMARMIELVQDKISRLSKVSGQSQVYMSNDLNQVLIEAERQAKTMQDEYVSVEHILLGLLQKSNRVLSEVFKQFNIKFFTFAFWVEHTYLFILSLF